ncbi:MAG: asparagine synthase (glutamine-hydrolyzing) [Brumimicrobium sp.]|nr:asparagine synthase (glutamine-hydrolyzing) [Brumimicrobium sp.]
MGNIIGIKKFLNPLKKSDQTGIENGLRWYSPDPSDFTSLHTDRYLLSYSGKQTSTSLLSDETDRYSLILDGKIYNYPELKNGLLKKGAQFQSSAEIEVLLKFLIENKENGIRQLRGEFALAFYDNQEDELLLARDILGIKPLVYAIQEDEIIFSSEVMPLKHLLTSWNINPSAVNTYFTFSYIPAPYTIIQEINKLLPGHYLKIKKSDYQIVSYEKIKMDVHSDLSFPDALQELKETIENSLIERLDESNKAVTFLSGGIDSSIISLLSSQNKDDLSTFSVGFHEDIFFDETKYAQLVSERIKSHHSVVKLTAKDFITSFQDILDTMDEPYADSSAVALYFLVQEASKHTSIFLSGDGADELFAGYFKHKAFQKGNQLNPIMRYLLGLVRLLPNGTRNSKFSNKIRQLKRFQQFLSKEWPNNYWMLAAFIPQERRKSLLLHEENVSFPVPESEELLNNVLLLDQQFVLPYDMLKKVDVIGRKFGVEIRAPFLDIEVVNLANRLKQAYKLKGNQGKYILREAYKDRLPAEIFNRSKRGFEIPLYNWLKSIFEILQEEEYWTEEFLNSQALFNPKGVEKMVVDFKKGSQDAVMSFWAFIVFQNWYKRWIEK